MDERKRTSNEATVGELIEKIGHHQFLGRNDGKSCCNSNERNLHQKQNVISCNGFICNA